MRSWYISFFQTPLLPELLWRAGLSRPFSRALEAGEGVPPPDGHPARTMARADAAGVALYRANMAQRLRKGIGVCAICPGVVNTNITRTFRFVGVDDGAQERSRERATRAYARRGFGPEGVAERIVAAVRDDRALVPVTPEARLGYLVSRVSPGAMRLLARLKPG